MKEDPLPTALFEVLSATHATAWVSRHGDGTFTFKSRFSGVEVKLPAAQILEAVAEAVDMLILRAQGADETL